MNSKGIGMGPRKFQGFLRISRLVNYYEHIMNHLARLYDPSKYLGSVKF